MVRWRVVAVRYAPSGGAASGAFLPIAPGVDNPAMIQAGGVVGGNDCDDVAYHHAG